jgi:hypothetical protein
VQRVQRLCPPSVRMQALPIAASMEAGGSPAAAASASYEQAVLSLLESMGVNDFDGKVPTLLAEYLRREWAL